MSPTLLGQVQKALQCSSAAVPWLSRLQAIAEDPTESSRGLLGHFSSTQMDFIESLFVSMGYLILGDPLSILSSRLLIWPMWRRRGIALPSLIRIYVRRAPNLSPTLPDGGPAGRRACSNSVCRVAGARACLPLFGGAPGARASSPSAGGAAGRRACFSSASRVAGARACPLPPEEPTESVPVVTLPEFWWKRRPRTRGRCCLS